MAEISLRLNGEQRRIAVEPHETLLTVLRDRMALKSPKCGCDRGDCGACNVLLDGKSVRSCLIFAIELEGADVVTVEGLSAERLTPVQQSLLDYNAFQCGFCAPGIIISATELLRDNPRPTADEVRHALSGNLCRCTGYVPIIEAIRDCHHGACHQGDCHE